MIKTILFDFGNVLAFFDHERAIQRLLRHTDMPAHEFRQLIYVDNLIDRYECGQVSTEELFSVATQIGRLRCDFDEFVHAFCDIFWPNPPMVDLVPRLKSNGYRLVLASNTNAAHYGSFRKEFENTLALFDGIAVSHEAGARKPYAEFFDYAHQLTGCEKRECLFVDDLIENVKGARDFGWNTVQFTNFEKLTSDLRAAGISID